MKLIFPLFFLILQNLLVGISVGKEVDPDPGWVAESIRRHNEFRRGFNSPPLKLNAKVIEKQSVIKKDLDLLHL